MFLLTYKQLVTVKNIKKKIEDSIYQFESIDCPFCEKKTATECLSYSDRYNLPYVSNLCIECGLIFTSPRFTQDSYSKFYKEDYRNLYSNKFSDKNYFFDKQILKGVKLADYISDIFIPSKKTRILDVGCGMGGMLVPFNEFGCTTLGVDYGEDYIRYGVEKKLNIKYGSISDVSTDFKFDFVIYSHVFEHISDLNKELSLIKERLNTKGLLYIEVPGVLNLTDYRYDLKRYFQNAHTFNFSLSSLCNILTKNGFKLVKGDESIRAIFKKDSNDSNYKNDYDAINNYLSKAKKKKNRFKYVFLNLKELVKYFLHAIGLEGVIKSYLSIKKIFKSLVK